MKTNAWKKILSGVMVGTMFLSMTGCGGAMSEAASENTNTASTSAGTESTSGSASASDGDTIKVGILHSQSSEPQGSASGSGEQ